MGISNLLANTRSIQKPIKIKSLRNKRVAVDAFGWLHLALYPCAEDIYYNRAYKTKMVKYFMQRVTRLVEKGIEVLIVFDGMRLPAKLNTHQDRKQKRSDALENAKKYTNIDIDAARKYMQSAVKVTSEHVALVQAELKKFDIKFMVSPFEADAQLAYLCKNGHVDYVITEDSDLLAYGCPRVIFKLDKSQNGEGMLVEITKGKQQCTELNMKNWTESQFRTFCILCGCDYLDNIKGIGTKKAHQLVSKFKSIEKIIFNMRTMKCSVPSGYLEQFKRIERMFVYQYVFDPQLQEIVHLTPVPEAHVKEVSNWDLGEKLCKSDALLLCHGKKSALDFQTLSESQESNLSMDKENLNIHTPVVAKAPKKRYSAPTTMKDTTNVKKVEEIIIVSENTPPMILSTSKKRVNNTEFRNMVNLPAKKPKKVITNPFFQKWLKQ
eukprot:NODE_13_length_54415_cov_0.522424.p10 type:complete len:437 gc:universal NODE_13_length_54415_cov_0.522424:43026-44336(+)